MLRFVLTSGVGLGVLVFVVWLRIYFDVVLVWVCWVVLAGCLRFVVRLLLLSGVNSVGLT